LYTSTARSSGVIVRIGAEGAEGPAGADDPDAKAAT
jgi:hypothetical protein